jgi:hypothetical protein
MFRYNGTAWTRVFFPDPPTFGQSWYDNSQLLGFGPNNIYVVGAEWYWNPSPPPNFFDSSSVLRFDGNQWKPVELPGRSGWLTKIWANSANEIYVAGRDAIMYFNGTEWLKYMIPVSVATGSERSGVGGLTGNRNGVVFLTYGVYEPAFARERYYFLSLRNGVWSQLDSAVIEPGNIQRKWGYGELWTSPSGTTYSVDQDVWRWNGSSWSVIYSFGASDLTYITGTSDDNIFVTGTSGAFLHFNGRDWFQYQNLHDRNLMYVSAWTDGKEVFVSGWPLGGRISILLHGK